MTKNTRKRPPSDSSDCKDHGLGQGWGHPAGNYKFARAPPKKPTEETEAFLEKDYDEYVKEDPSADVKLTPFDAYDKIYKAFGDVSNKEHQKIRRRFGHADLLNHG